MSNPVTKLPNHEKAIIEEQKITKYLLCLESPKGRSKAKFFLSHGFTLENWDIFANALRQHAVDNLVAKIETHPYGVYYIIECNIRTPDHESPCIRVVWNIDEGEVIPRLISAYPH